MDIGQWSAITSESPHGALVCYGEMLKCTSLSASAMNSDIFLPLLERDLSLEP